MAKYTIELYCLIDNFLPDDKDLDDMYVEGKTPQEILEIMKFYQKFGLADYDVYGDTAEEQRNNRDRINHKILGHSCSLVSHDLDVLVLHTLFNSQSHSKALYLERAGILRCCPLLNLILKGWSEHIETAHKREYTRSRL